MYSAMVGDAMAFHASSMMSALRPFFRRIFCRNTSMMMSVTMGKRSLSSLILSISKTMNRSSKSELSMSLLSVYSSSPPL